MRVVLVVSLLVASAGCKGKDRWERFGEKLVDCKVPLADMSSRLTWLAAKQAGKPDDELAFDFGSAFVEQIEREAVCVENTKVCGEVLACLQPR